MEYKNGLKCIRCGSEIPITYGSIKYCSPRCGRLYLKKIYRDTHKDRIRLYRRKYRFTKFEKESRINTGVEVFGSRNECYFCKTDENLNWHHMLYKPEKVIRVCSRCHSRIHNVLNITQGKI